MKCRKQTTSLACALWLLLNKKTVPQGNAAYFSRNIHGELINSVFDFVPFFFVCCIVHECQKVKSQIATRNIVIKMTRACFNTLFVAHKPAQRNLQSKPKNQFKIRLMMFTTWKSYWFLHSSLTWDYKWAYIVCINPNEFSSKQRNIWIRVTHKCFQCYLKL